MKKTTVLLIALCLVCTSVFASFSLTLGAGFGGNISLSETYYPYKLGPAGFLGIDFILDNGLSFYNDIEYNCITTKGNLKQSFGYSIEEKPISMLTDKTGVGYTFKTEHFELMLGAGPEVQLYFEGTDSYSIRFGVDTRVKGTFILSDNFGLSFQFTPACEFVKRETMNFEVSANALLGMTFKF